MKKDMQIQSGFRSSWKTIRNLFRSLYTLGRRKDTQKRYDQRDGIYLELINDQVALSTRENDLYSFVSELRFLTYWRALYVWFSLIQVEVDDDPAESKKDDQDDQTEVYLLLFPCSENLSWSDQIIARCARIVSLELLCPFSLKQRKKKTKKVVERYWDWELTNETQPIWVKDCLM